MAPRQVLVRRVLVLGGGVAGLAAAISLARQGAQVTVAERDAGWPAAGYGLSLRGTALRGLEVLGLAEPCVWAGYGANQEIHCDAAGEIENVVELPRVLGPDRPALVGMAHGTLHQILRGEAVNSGARLGTGLAATRIAQTEDGVGVRLSDGSTAHADLVVGADGGHSAVRTLVGLDGQPRPTGEVSWQVTVPRPSWLTAPHRLAGPAVAGAGNAGVAVVPISPRLASVRVTESGAGPAPLTDDARVERIRAVLGALPGRFAEIAASVVASRDVVRQPVHASDGQAPRHRGRVVLLGDAARAPGDNDGVARAVEDAISLTEELTSHDDLEHALKTFAERRST